MRSDMKLDLKALGERIRSARIKKGMSQIELAEICSLSVPYVSDLERGKKCFSIETLYRISDALQVSADWLLRTNIPENEVIYHSEASELFADCSHEERNLLLALLAQIKDTLRKHNHE